MSDLLFIHLLFPSSSAGWQGSTTCVIYVMCTFSYRIIYTYVRVRVFVVSFTGGAQTKKEVVVESGKTGEEDYRIPED